jgi:hypothetical protein
MIGLLVLHIKDGLSFFTNRHNYFSNVTIKNVFCFLMLDYFLNLFQISHRLSNLNVKLFGNNTFKFACPIHHYKLWRY